MWIFKTKILVITLVISMSMMSFRGCTTDNNPLIGVWWDQLGISTQFFSDGTVTSGGILSITGNYSFPDSNHLKIELSGLWGLAGDQIYEFTIDESELYLKTTYGIEIHLSKNKPDGSGFNFDITSIPSDPYRYVTLQSPFNGSGDWYLTQAFGAYLKDAKYGIDGQHTGEDWNKVGDDNEEVYPIAAGKVIDSGLVYSKDSDYGYFVIIRHDGLFKIPQSSGPHLKASVDLSYTKGLGSNNYSKIVYSKNIFNTNLSFDNDFYNEKNYQYSAKEVNVVYSVYLHLKSKLKIGSEITDIRKPIGNLLASNKKHSSHLHLEIRVGETDASIKGSVLAGKTKGGYFVSSQEMVNAGYLEPSSIIQANNN